MIVVIVLFEEDDIAGYSARAPCSYITHTQNFWWSRQLRSWQDEKQRLLAEAEQERAERGRLETEFRTRQEELKCQGDQLLQTQLHQIEQQWLLKETQ